MYSYIYGLMCPYDNVIKYIGQSTQKPETRLMQHKNDNRYNTKKTNWINKIKKLGLREELKLIILEECNTELLNEREKYWIKYYSDSGIQLKNCTDGGDCEYRVVSQETKERMSKNLKGKTLGRKLSDETKKLISEKRKGYKPTTEAKNSISNGLRKYYLEKNGIIKKDIPKIKKEHYLKGKNISAEVREKISNSRKGKCKGEQNYMYGKHLSETQKENLSKAIKKYYSENKSPFYGKKHTDETKKIISKKASERQIGENNPFYGKKHTEETKKMISDIQMDIILKPFYILDKDYNIIKLFTKRSEVFEFLGISQNNTQVYRVMDKGKLYKGYYFIRKEKFQETFSKLFGKDYAGFLP